MRENCTYSLSGGRWPARKCATSDPTPEKAPNKGKTSGGAGGKAVDQGERNERTHGPGPGLGTRVKGTSRRGGSRAKRQGTQVHHAAAPRERATAFGQLLSVKETSCARSGSGDVERV